MVAGRTSPSRAYPVRIASLARAPFALRKGRAVRPSQTLLDSRVRVLCTTLQTTDSRSDHVRRPVAPPLWIPAFAGMTVVMHSTRPRE